MFNIDDASSKQTSKLPGEHREKLIANTSQLYIFFDFFFLYFSGLRPAVTRM